MASFHRIGSFLNGLYTIKSIERGSKENKKEIVLHPFSVLRVYTQPRGFDRE